MPHNLDQFTGVYIEHEKVATYLTHYLKTGVYLLKSSTQIAPHSVLVTHNTNHPRAKEFASVRVLKPTQLHSDHRAFTDVIQEAQAIVAYAKSIDRLYVTSDNQYLTETVKALAAPLTHVLYQPTSYSQTQAGQLLITTAKCLYGETLLNSDIQELYTLLNSDIQELYPSTQFDQIPTQAPMIESLLQIRQQFSLHTKYSFQKLHSAHTKILADFTTNIPKFTLPTNTYTPAEYVTECIKMSDSWVTNITTQPNQINIIPYHAVPFHQVSHLWVAGLDQESEAQYVVIDPKTNYITSHSRTHKNVAVHPHHTRVNKPYKQPSTLVKLHNNYQYPQTQYCQTNISPKQISLFRSDPYAFFVHYILRLTSPQTSLQVWIGRYIHQLLHKVITTQPKTSMKDYVNTELKDQHIPAVLSQRILDKIIPMLASISDTMDQSSSIHAEVRGAKDMQTPKGTCYTLHARADMMCTKHSTTIVVEYKTGQLPTKSQLVDGTQPQIAILMYLLDAKGFPSVARQRAISPYLISPTQVTKPSIDYESVIHEVVEPLVAQLLDNTDTKYIPTTVSAEYPYLPLMRDYSEQSK